MSEALLKQLDGLQTDLAGYISKSKDEKEKADQVLEETKQNIVETGEKIETLEQQLKEFEKWQASSVADKEKARSMGAQVISLDEYKQFQSGEGRFQTAVQKSVSSADASAGHLIQPQRGATVLNPFVDESLRGLFTVIPTESNAIEWVKENVFTNSAAPVAEGAEKPESDITFSEESETVKTIAHWIHISRQAADDGGQLMSIIDTKMTEGLRDVENTQIMTGDGTGQNLNGLLTQATAATLAETVNADRVAETILACSQAGYAASAIIMNPVDWFAFQITKDGNNNYIFGGPQAQTSKVMWGLPVVTNNDITAGTFMVGAYRRAVDLYDRMTVEVRISDQDRDNFIKNMLTLRAEERLALTVTRPAAIQKGTLL